MKATLSFKLPEEQEEFSIAQKGGHYLYVIEELDSHLRSKLKYEELTEEAAKIYQEIRDMLWSLRNDE
jgi:hypothetical protein